MTLKKNRFEAGVELTPANIEGIGGIDLTREGEIDVDSDDSRLKVRVEAATRTVVTENQTQPLTNKSINGSLNTLTNITATTNANLTGPITSVGNATSVASQTGTGSTFVMDTSPTLITPNLGTPSAVVLTNATGTASGLTAGTVTTNANLTGAVTSVGNATSLGSFSSSDLSTALTDETGSGSAVFATSPTLVTPALGTPSALVGTNITGTASGLTAGNVTTNANLTGAITSVGNATSLGSFTSAQLATALTDETGSGANVFATSPTITTASIVTPTRLDMKQDTLANLQTYAATAANGQLVFATDTKATYVVKDGALSAVGGAGAGINYILSPDADSGIGLWTTYADAAGTSPVDGTGGSPVLTYTITTSSPLRGTSSFLITKDAANRQGNGASYDLTIDASDKGKVLQCSFEYQIASGTFADNDLSVWIYDVTNATLIQPAPYLIKNSGIIEKFAVEFQTAINSTSYRLILHCTSTSAVAYTVKLDNFNLGPQAKLYGSAITDGILFTPTGSWTTNTTYAGFYQRIGNKANINVQLALSGAPTSTGLTVNLPPGLSIDTTQLAAGTSSQLLDGVAFLTDDNGSFYPALLRYSSPTAIRIDFMDDAATGVVDAGQLTQSVPITFANLDKIGFTVLVPIVGWSSSQIFSSDADTRVVAARYKCTTADTTSSTDTINYDTKVIDTHSAVTTSASAWKFTAPVPGIYRVSAGINSAASAGLNNLYVYKNGSLVLALAQVIPTGVTAGGSSLVELIAGDYIDIRNGSASATLNNDSAANWIAIDRLSGPAQIAASESVNARAVQSSGQSITNSGSAVDLVWDTAKTYDSHGSLTASTGIFVAPMSGKYRVTGKIRFASSAWTAGNEANIVLARSVAGGAYSTYSFLDARNFHATVTQEMSLIGSDTVSLNAGDAIKIQALNTRTGGATSLSAAGTVNFIAIERVGN